MGKGNEEPILLNSKEQQMGLQSGQDREDITVWTEMGLDKWNGAMGRNGLKLVG